jgi:hypothetical protein
MKECKRILRKANKIFYCTKDENIEAFCIFTLEKACLKIKLIQGDEYQ